MVQNVSQYISVLGLLYDTSSICTNLKQTPSLQLSLRPVASVAWKETPTAVAQKRLLSTGLATNKPRVAVAWLVSLCASLSYRTKTLQTAPSWWCKKGQHSLIWWGFSYSIYSIMGIPMNQTINQPSTINQSSNNTSQSLRCFIPRWSLCFYLSSRTVVVCWSPDRRIFASRMWYVANPFKPKIAQTSPKYKCTTISLTIRL